MESNKIFFFSCPSPLSTSSNEILYKGIEVYKSKEELLNIDNSKKQLNHQLNIVILKKIAKYYFFASQIYLKVLFQKKNLITARTPTEMIQDLL